MADEESNAIKVEWTYCSKCGKYKVMVGNMKSIPMDKISKELTCSCPEK